MAQLDDYTKQLITLTAEQLLNKMDAKDNVSLRTAVFTDVTRTGKQVQLQIIVTDTDLLNDFTTEETKHYGSFEDFKERNK